MIQPKPKEEVWKCTFFKIKVWPLITLYARWIQSSCLGVKLFHHFQCFKAHNIFLLLQVLNFDSPRGSMSLETEKNRTGTSSKLFVTRSTEVNLGSCKYDSSCGQPKTTAVQISCNTDIFLLFQVLNFDSPRGGISLETEKTRTGTSSKLLVTRATEVDSGSYTCDPSRGQPKTADVHIITGKLL